MSLRQKLMAVLTIPAIVLIVATALAYQASQRRTDSTTLVTRTYEARNLVDLVIADMAAAESSLRGHLITGDPGMLRPYERSREELHTHLQLLGELAIDDEASRLARALANQATYRLETLDELASAAAAGEPVEAARVKTLTREGEFTMQNALGIAEHLRMRELELLAERSAKLESAEDLSFVIRMFVLPIGLLIAGVFVARFSGRLVRRIESLSDNTRRLEQGLPLLDSSAHRDELGDLERTLVQAGTRVIELQGELHRLATVDPLTGLANRRGFQDIAAFRLDMARRETSPLALLFIDADDLKRVNDTHGHATGDEMLQEIAALLRDTFRTSDIPARLGGDEFCVLVSADTVEGIDAARHRLAETIEMANRLPGRTYGLSVSMGIAVFDAVHDRTVDDLIARADGLMYQDKRAKREAAEGPIDDVPVPPEKGTPSDGVGAGDGFERSAVTQHS